MTAFYIYLLIVNLVAFAMYGIDKYKARHDQWRIPEKALISIAVLGGSIGAWMGMQYFHHKTLHKRFTVGIPLIFLCQLVLAYYVIFD